MTGRIPALWLGDLARAEAALQPKDAATRQRIAALLGFASETALPEVSRGDSVREIVDPRPGRGGRDGPERAWFDPDDLDDVRPAAVEKLSAGGHEVPWQSLRVLVGYANGVLAVYGPDRKAPLFRANGSGDSIRAAVASSDGRYALTLFRGSTPSFSDLRTNRHLGLMPLDYGVPTAAAMTPDRRLAAFGTGMGTVAIWALPRPERELPTVRHLQTLEVFSEEVTALAFSPDAQRVAVGSAKGIIELWDLDSGQRRSASYMHKEAVTALAFTPDGRWLVSSAADAFVSLWDTDGDMPPRHLGSHDRRVESIAISPNGGKALSAAAGSIVLWDLNGGRRRTFKSADYKRPMAAAFDTSGRPALVHVQGKSLELLALDAESGALEVVMSRPMPSEPSVITIIPSLPNRASLPSAEQDPLPPSEPWMPGAGPGEPLVAPHRLPAMLRDLLATESADGAPDADTLVEWIARGEPIRTLPRQKRRTLRRGVQVLEDWSPSTLPFRRDMEPLRRQLDRLFTGSPPILRFRGLPDAGDLIGAEAGSDTYQPPRPHTPVLVIGGPTDLDGEPMAGAAPCSEWRRFAVRLATSGCPLLVLSPFIGADRARHVLHSFGRIMAWEQNLPPAHQGLTGEIIGEPRRDAPFALHALWRQDRQAFRLTVLLSLATRVEPRLVRAMRHRLLPRTDTRTEAVLWRSGVVNAAVPEMFEFADDAQTALFRELARHKHLLDAAWEVTRACRHTDYPQILLLEEEARYRGLRRRAADRRWLEDLFKRIAATLSPKRQGLASWAMRVESSLPEQALRARQAANVQELAHAAFARGRNRGGRLFVGWTNGTEKGRRGLALQLVEAEAAKRRDAIEVPAGSPLVLDLHTGNLGAPRRRQTILLSTGRPQVLPVPARGSVELAFGTGSRWVVRDRSDVAVVIGHYEGDAPLARQLAEDLRQRGVVVRRLIDITTEEGATEATRAAERDRGIALLGPAALPYITRPGLHTRGPDPILVTKGLLPSDLPERLRMRERFDLTLPATGLDRLLRKLGNREWEDDDFWEVGWEEGPKLKGWPLARIHGMPPSKDISVWPALKDFLQALRQPVGFVTLSGSHPEERHAAAVSLGRLPELRRRFSDGIFYLPRFERDAAAWVLHALGLPARRLRESESLQEAGDILREGRCLVIAEDGPEPFDPERLMITGSNSRTVLLVDLASPRAARSVRRWGSEEVKINVPEWGTVNFRYAPGDEALALRLTLSLQAAGVPVRHLPISEGQIFTENPELFLLTPRSAELLAGMAESGVSVPWPGRGPFFVLHRGWDGPLPALIAGATALDMRKPHWASRIAWQIESGR